MSFGHHSKKVKSQACVTFLKRFLFQYKMPRLRDCYNELALFPQVKLQSQVYTCHHLLKIKGVFVFFSVRLLSVLRGHSVFSSPTSKDFYTRSHPLHYFPILNLEKKNSISLFNVEC